MRKATWLVLTLLAVTNEAQADATPAHSILEIPPSARSWGMAGAGGAVVDPFVAYYNPAGVGILALDRTIGVAYNHQQWVPTFTKFRYGGMYQNALAVAGLSFSSGGDSSSAINLGVGLSFQQQILKRSDYNIRERSNNFTVGLAVEHGVEIGAGVTCKSIRLDLGPPGGSEEIYGAGTATAWDIGGFARVRLPHALYRLGLMEGTRFPGPIKPEIAISMSYNVANRGRDHSSFIGGTQYIRSSRYNRLAASLGGECNYKDATIAQFLVAFDRESANVYHSEKTNRTGLEAGLFGVFQIRAGHLSWDWPKSGTSTIGGSIHLNGIVRWVDALGGNGNEHLVPRIVRNLDVYAHAANVTTGDAVLSGTKFREIGVTLNLDGILGN